MNQRVSGRPGVFGLLVFALLLFLAAAAQSTFSARIAVLGAQPDFVLTLALVAALLSDALTGAVIGLIAGWMSAALVGQTVGTFLVSRTLAGFGAGLATTRLYRGNIGVVILGVVAASLAAEAIYVLSAPRIGLSPAALRALLLAPLYNVIVSLPLLALLRRCGWGEKEH